MSPRLLKHLATINRNQAVGTNGRHAQGPIASGVRCTFIPMSGRTEIENQYQIGTGFDVYFPIAQDVKTGDQLLWNGGTFNVRGVRDYVAGRLSHRHALVTREGK